MEKERKLKKTKKHKIENTRKRDAYKKVVKIRYTKEENNNVMSRYDHKIETSLEGIVDSYVSNIFPKNQKEATKRQENPKVKTLRSH